MGCQGYKDQIRLLYNMIFAKRCMSDGSRYLLSRRQLKTEPKEKRKISFFDSTPEESWEWWKYDQR
jgi:hypothetical protein